MAVFGHGDVLCIEPDCRYISFKVINSFITATNCNMKAFRGLFTSSAIEISLNIERAMPWRIENNVMDTNSQTVVRNTRLCGYVTNLLLIYFDGSKCLCN